MLTILNWVIKHSIVAKYRLDKTWLGTGFSIKGEDVGFQILVNHYFEDHYTSGTQEVWYESSNNR